MEKFSVNKIGWRIEKTEWDRIIGYKRKNKSKGRGKSCGTDTEVVDYIFRVVQHASAQLSTVFPTFDRPTAHVFASHSLSPLVTCAPRAVKKTERRSELAHGLPRIPEKLCSKLICLCLLSLLAKTIRNCGSCSLPREKPSSVFAAEKIRRKKCDVRRYVNKLTLPSAGKEGIFLSA